MTEDWEDELVARDPVTPDALAAWERRAPAVKAALDAQIGDEPQEWNKRRRGGVLLAVAVIAVLAGIAAIVATDGPSTTTGIVVAPAASTLAPVPTPAPTATPETATPEPTAPPSPTPVLVAAPEIELTDNGWVSSPGVSPEDAAADFVALTLGWQSLQADVLDNPGGPAAVTITKPETGESVGLLLRASGDAWTVQRAGTGALPIRVNEDDTVPLDIPDGAASGHVYWTANGTTKDRPLTDDEFSDQIAVLDGSGRALVVIYYTAQGDPLTVKATVS